MRRLIAWVACAVLFAGCAGLRYQEAWRKVDEIDKQCRGLALPTAVEFEHCRNDRIRQVLADSGYPHLDCPDSY